MTHSSTFGENRERREEKKTVEFSFLNHFLGYFYFPGKRKVEREREREKKQRCSVLSNWFPDRFLYFYGVFWKRRLIQGKRKKKMLEGKALIQDTDMPVKMQVQAMAAASQALDLYDVLDCTSIAAYIKKVRNFYLFCC